MSIFLSIILAILGVLNMVMGFMGSPVNFLTAFACIGMALNVAFDGPPWLNFVFAILATIATVLVLILV